MRFQAPLVTGTLVRRYKRFLADVRLEDGTVVVAHTPNSGSMATCFEPGCEVALSHHPEPHRKLAYTWELSRMGRAWIGVNTAHPNQVVAEGLKTGAIAGLEGYDSVRREVPYGKASRIDVLLEGRRGRAWVEVKNTTLRDGRLVRFPDSVTERGLKHLRELTRVVREGDRGVMIFFVNRPDCEAFAPASAIDPDYAKGLRAAVKNGVEAIALATKSTLRGIDITGTLPIQLDA